MNISYLYLLQVRSYDKILFKLLFIDMPNVFNKIAAGLEIKLSVKLNIMVNLSSDKTWLFN